MLTSQGLARGYDKVVQNRHAFCDSILYMPVPHTLHLPLTAGRPFFIVTRCMSTMAVFFRHFTQ
jgi:hypothetical protein